MLYPRDGRRIVVMFALLRLGPSLRAVISWDTGILLSRSDTDHDGQATPRRCAGGRGLRTTALGLRHHGGAAFFSMFAVLACCIRRAAGSCDRGTGIARRGHILLSWLFAHTIFAVHYAHERFRRFQSERAWTRLSGNDDTPDYGFPLFLFRRRRLASLDVQVITSAGAGSCWRTAVSFLYNTIVPLSINLLAGLL